MKKLGKVMLSVALGTLLGVAGAFLNDQTSVALAADQSVSYETGDALQQPHFVDSFGEITAEDVIIRSAPSTAGDILGVLSKGARVGIVDVYECKDEKAAILNIDKGSIDFGDYVLVLYRGMAMTIDEENEEGYLVHVNANDQVYSFSVNKEDVRKIYGEIWYQISPNPNYEIPGGYVFGDYVKFI